MLIKYSLLDGVLQVGEFLSGIGGEGEFKVHPKLVGRAVGVLVLAAEGVESQQLLHNLDTGTRKITTPFLSSPLSLRVL